MPTAELARRFLRSKNPVVSNEFLFDLGESSRPPTPPAAFSQLPETRHFFLYAAAWNLETIGVTEWTKRLAEVPHRNSEGKRWKIPEVREELQKLTSQGFFVQAPGKGYEMPVTLAHPLAVEVAENPELLAACERFIKTNTRHLRFSYGFAYLQPMELVRVQRDLRNGFLVGDHDRVRTALQLLQNQPANIFPWEFLHLIPDVSRLAKLPEDLQAQALDAFSETTLTQLMPAGELLSCLQSKATSADQRLRVAELALARGDFSAAEKQAAFLAKSADLAAPAAIALIHAGAAFLKGQDDAVIDAVPVWKKAIRKVHRKRKICPPGMFGCWIIMAMCRRRQGSDLAQASQLTEFALQGDDDRFEDMYFFLRDLVQALTAPSVPDLKREIETHVEVWISEPEPNLITYGVLAVAGPAGVDLRNYPGTGECLTRLWKRSESSGWRWVTAEAAALHRSLVNDPNAKDLPDISDIVPFSAALGSEEPWEKLLLGLESLSAEFGEGSATKPNSRSTAAKQLVWWLEADKYNWQLTPIERTISATGAVSKGRRVALKRLRQQVSTVPHLTDQDRKVIAHIREDRSWNGYGNYEIADIRALIDLTGHPLLFSNETCTKPLELTLVQPRITLSELPSGHIQMALSPAVSPGSQTHLKIESERRYLIVEVKPVHRQLAERLGKAATFPAGAKKRLSEALGGLAGKVAVESDDIGSTAQDLPIIEGDPTPVLRLIPAGTGLHARLMIRPLEGLDREERPGEGRPMLMAQMNGRPIRLRRDLAAERQNADTLLQACPTLATTESEGDGAWNYTLETPLECLDLLAELESLEQARVEWPEGQTFRLRAVATSDNFQVSLGGSSEWLSASGELRVDDDLVLPMRQLLELMGSATETPGFIPLEDGQFLALTRAFRAQLEDLKTFSQPGKGQQLRIHPLAAGALSGLAENPGSKLSAAWKKQMKRLRDAEAQNPVKPPSTLKAELRPYQIDGYRWLRRLADGGIGACLADDMGLGKTLQSLALLLDRAPDGPALVVAPTSVAANWLEETLRFAPTLRPILYGREGGDRTTTLAEAGPFDLIIVSYGLLQNDADAFATVKWHTAILDEAQSIKNRSTKRFQAVSQLQAAFRLITTGTPVENRLSELHALFSFINPGFLGSWDYFRTTFADPIERRQDDAARERLRRLVRPFILRRLKSSVLQDLPARTEIPLHVELSPEEAAFYEALRQKAVSDLENAAAQEGATPGHAAIRVLAELTRLRRACCHPRLIDAATPLEGSKLRVFTETLEEILAGGHKALVFSQFVDHLSILRDHLDSAGIAYQYLDGSTPAAQRQKSVTAFQRGEGDVFLISLKAGGFGLNLTAADYVIHMDPWWNPAAEDQASDRAHRIGQTRPVTIYRLITTGTIEEKIVDLHRHKRELADSILDGTDAAAHLSTDDLLALLRE